MEQQSDSSRGLLRSVDLPTVLIFLLLVAAGWISVTGACYTYGENDFFDFSTRSGKQLVWILCSCVIGLVILLTDERIYDTFASIIYVAMLILLAVTPFIASNVKGSYSWINLGPVSLQPAEFAKCATALALARCMSTYGFSIRKLSDCLHAVLIVLLPIILIFLQQETGSALVYFAFLLVFYREGMSGSVLFVVFAAVVYFVVGLRYAPYTLPYTLTSQGGFIVLLLIWVFSAALSWIYVKSKQITGRLLFVPAVIISLAYLFSRFIIPFDIAVVQVIACAACTLYLLFEWLRRRSRSCLLIGAFIVGSLALHMSTNYLMNDVLQPHQQMRIRVLLGLEHDLTGAGYNVHQSQIAIGSGGLMGKGFLNGTQTKLKYVPEQDTDFIFCTVGEEHGFVGATVVLLLFLALILRLIYLSERQSFAFGRIYGYCVLSIFLFHIFINIGMVMGITPVIGIPLPFFSYGGSSMWGFSILLFIFLRIDASRDKYRH